jgi:V8-like Glu-specific endopeptidase
MTLTNTQISQLYVTLFGRASEGEGNTYWQTNDASYNMGRTADIMLGTTAAKTYFGSTVNSDLEFIEHIYRNTLGKTYDEDIEGVNFWVNELAQGKTRGEVVAALITAAQHPDNSSAAQNQFNNRVEVSNYAADTLLKFTDYTTFSSFITGVTAVDFTVTSALNKIDQLNTSPSPLPHDEVVLPSNLTQDWVDNTEITTAPHKAIGQIVFKTANQTFLGTGFLISPEHVLTNAHVLLDEEGQLKSNMEITFTPGLNGDASKAVNYSSGQAWVENYFDSDLYSEWPDNDLGIIKLDQPIGNQLGYLKLTPDINDNLVGASVWSAGYPSGQIEQDNPATPGQDYYQWEISGTIDRYILGNTVLELSNSMKVTAGASGSPIYYTQNNETYFTGVLAGTRGNETVAVAMDQDSHNWILGILQQDGYYTNYTLV